MEKKYFETYFELERKHWWFKARQKILEGIIRKRINQKELKILNVGASTGYSSIWLSSFGEVESVEYDKDCCEFLRETVKIEVVNASIENLPYEDNQFDLVCAFDVIEHVENDQKGVDEMARVCKKNGFVFVTVPAFEMLWSEHDEINHHQRRYTLPQLSNLFDKDRIMFKTYFNFWLFPPIAFFRVISSAFKRLKPKKEKAESDFGVIKENKLIDKLLFNLFSSESQWLENGKTLPFGISIGLLWNK